MEFFKILKSISYLVLVPLFAYTGLSAELVGILTVLIIMDMLTATVREAIVSNGRITSRSFWIGISAKMLLILVPFVVILVGKGSGINLLTLGKLTLSTFILAEGYSTLGNIVQIRKKDKSIDEQDAITGFIKGIEKIFKNFLVSLMQK